MNIQIFGSSKCFDTKKAQRFFKERGIKYQYVDILEKSKRSGSGALSKGELNSVIASVGIDALVSDKPEEYRLFKHLTADAKPDKLLECPKLYRTPIVRNGKDATVGYCPDIWKGWK